MTDAQIIAFPGCKVPEVAVEAEDFDTVRAAVEQEVGTAATDLGACDTEAEWFTALNVLIERLRMACERKAPDG